jgi:hypothetical protein
VLGTLSSRALTLADARATPVILSRSPRRLVDRTLVESPVMPASGETITLPL